MTSGAKAAFAEVFNTILDEKADVKYSEEVHSDNNTDELSEMSKSDEEAYARLALDFAKSVHPDKELVISEMIPIYNADVTFSGYECKFELNGSKHGYVIVDNALEGDYILEFNLNPNTSISLVLV